MRVRNFYLSGSIDGRETLIGAGPRARDGGFEARVHVRDAGEVRWSVVSIQGFADDDGRLRLVVRDERGEEVHCIEMQR
jgi:hypothetical protein